MVTLAKRVQFILFGILFFSQNAFAELTSTEVQSVNLAKTLVLESKVEAVNQTTLAAQTSGQIKQIFVDAGDVVKAGTLLIALKDDNQQANVDAAQAALKARIADFQDAKKSYQRAKNLFEKKLTSQQSLDDAKARFNISLANKQAAQAVLTSAQEQLSYTKIIAPYDGIVLERLVNLGEIVNAGTPLFVGTSLNNLRVVSQVPQQDIAAIRQYLSAEMLLPDGQKIAVNNDDIHIYAYANTQAATFKVRIALPQQVNHVYPGMYLKTYFKIGERQSLLIPKSALVKRAELRAVYLQDKQGQLHFRQIKVGDLVNNNNIEVLAGLSAGEKVILKPEQAIQLLYSSRKSGE
jgi:RND family efflux transporter MFP subunit